MVVALAASIHAAITTPGHDFDRFDAVLFFLADVVIAGAIVPSLAVRKRGGGSACPFSSHGARRG